MNERFGRSRDYLYSLSRQSIKRLTSSESTRSKEVPRVSSFLFRAVALGVSKYAVRRAPLNRLFAYAKTKTQISFAVTAKLISAFVFATRLVQSLYFLIPKFQASSHLLWLYSPVCVRPGRKPRRPVFS